MILQIHRLRQMRKIHLNPRSTLMNHRIFYLYSTFSYPFYWQVHHEPLQAF